MDLVNVFCEKFCKYIEGGNVEYFRYPEYKKIHTLQAIT